jgi:outer membrane murein-binding lipoprotein Lpp
MKLFPLNLSSGTRNIVIVGAVVVGAVVVGVCVALVAIAMRNGRRVVEGMAAATTPLDALKTQINALQTRYDTLDNSITAQTNTITGHSHTLYKILSDAPTQSNNITHANVNMDDPSKTPMKNISMS